jgi:cytosine/adenosine deaminase-related metal-dependent hydrolase
MENSERLVLRGAVWPGDLSVELGRISEVGSIEPREGDRELRCDGCIITPGLVNTHHHLYQWLTRGRAVNSGLFEWLQELYPIWARLRPEDAFDAAVVGLAELALSGTTTVSDHHYVVPGGDDSIFDAIAQAARLIGLRLHLSRGSMDLGESNGGLPPDSIVEETEAILASTQAVYERLHDGQYVFIDVSPCSPFSVSTQLLRGSADLARQLGLRMHTHLAETIDEERDCLTRFGARPVDILEDLGWIAPDVWFAHGIHLNEDEIQRLGQAGSGIAHCPSSNARLGSGVCPVVRLRRSGAPVGLGVDGPASNEVGRLQPEMRQALYLARITSGNPSALTPMEAIEMATSGGADCLGHDDLGRLVPGARADLAVWDVSDLADMPDPLDGLVLGPDRLASKVLVEGRLVVEGGELLNVNMSQARARLNKRARELWSS